MAGPRSPRHRARSGRLAAQSCTSARIPIGKARVRGYHRQDFLEKEIFEHFLGRDPLIRSPETQTEQEHAEEDQEEPPQEIGERMSGCPRANRWARTKSIRLFA